MAIDKESLVELRDRGLEEAARKIACQSIHFNSIFVLDRECDGRCNDTRGSILVTLRIEHHGARTHLRMRLLYAASVPVGPTRTRFNADRCSLDTATETL